MGAYWEITNHNPIHITNFQSQILISITTAQSITTNKGK